MMVSALCHWVLKMDSTSIPVINFGGDSIHAIDSFHERSRYTSQEEVDESVLVGDFTESYMVFELGNVISEWEVLCNRSSGVPGDGFILNIVATEIYFCL